MLTDRQSGRNGGRQRRNTSRWMLSGRAWRRYTANATPTSCESGRLRSRCVLPARTKMHPRTQSISSTRSRITSPARSPKRARRSTIARSRRPYFDSASHAASTRSTSSAEIVLGIDECRHVRTAGTAPCKPAATAPFETKKRIIDRIAVTGCPQALGRNFAASRRTKSVTVLALSLDQSTFASPNTS